MTLIEVGSLVIATVLLTLGVTAVGAMVLVLAKYPPLVTWILVLAVAMIGLFLAVWRLVGQSDDGEI